MELRTSATWQLSSLVPNVALVSTSTGNTYQRRQAATLHNAFLLLNEASNLPVFLPIMLALCHFYESTYYAGSNARIIAASLAGSGRTTQSRGEAPSEVIGKKEAKCLVLSAVDSTCI